MRRIATLALWISTAVLTIVAVAVNSGPLFYMGTAMMVTLGVCRVQAWLSVRGLKFERVAPPKVVAGETATIELAVWSEHAVRRPLISVIDHVPESMGFTERTPSLPVAPAHDSPIRTQYRIRPLARGRYVWNTLTVVGADALGLVEMTKTYKTEPTEIVVLPVPIPVHVDIPRSSGWGMTESDHGMSRGEGIDPRGIREYSSGDSLRHVHWRSTARTGRLLVKEFEAGSHGRAAFVLQRTMGSDLGKAGESSLDRACGHVAHIAREMLRQGTDVALPGLIGGSRDRHTRVDYEEFATALAGADAGRSLTVGEEVLALRQELPAGATVYVTLSVADETLPIAAAALQSLGIRLVALAYDPRQWNLGSRSKTVASPVEPEYLARLRVAGIRTLIMPEREAK